MVRISVEEYLDRTTKTISQGIPRHYAVFRHEDGLTVRLWPVPDQTEYQIVVYKLMYIQDTGGFGFNPEVPRRFLPALTAGLAYKLALKKSCT